MVPFWHWFEGTLESYGKISNKHKEGLFGGEQLGHRVQMVLEEALNYQVGCKNCQRFSLPQYGHFLMMWLLNFSHPKVESVSLPFESWLGWVVYLDRKSISKHMPDVLWLEISYYHHESKTYLAGWLMILKAQFGLVWSGLLQFTFLDPTDTQLTY